MTCWNCKQHQCLIRVKGCMTEVCLQRGVLWFVVPCQPLETFTHKRVISYIDQCSRRVLQDHVTTCLHDASSPLSSHPSVSSNWNSVIPYLRARTPRLRDRIAGGGKNTLLNTNALSRTFGAFLNALRKQFIGGIETACTDSRPVNTGAAELLVAAALLATGKAWLSLQ